MSNPESRQRSPRSPMAMCGIWLRAIRWKQWVKNVLVLLPLVFAHQWSDPALLVHAVTAFVAFSMGASSIYLINDSLDREADRHHPRRKSRAVAAGLITLRAAWTMSGLLFFIGLGLALSLSLAFALVYGAYVFTSVFYSVSLKRVLMLDVLLLAGFYTIRIFAGSVATGIPISNWLLLFSMFFFLYLALQKRFCELHGWDQEDEPLRRRGYRRVDLDQIKAMGSSSGYLAVLVFALYIQSPEVTAHYTRPGVLWWVCPCLLYWISRLALLAGRGQVTEDAISFAFRDKASYVTGAVILIITLLAHPI